MTWGLGVEVSAYIWHSLIKLLGLFHCFNSLYTIMKSHGLPVPNVKGSNTVRNMAVLDPEINVRKGQPQQHSLWRTSTRFCPVLSSTVLEAPDREQGLLLALALCSREGFLIRGGDK